MLDFSKLPVEYKFTNGKRHSLKISKGNLLIGVPRRHRHNKNAVEKLIEQNLDWVQDNLHRLASHENLLSSKQIFFENLPTQIHFGPDYRLEFEDGNIFVHNSLQAREKMITILQRNSKTFLKSRVAELAGMHNFKFEKVKIAEQATRWGSCSTRGNINLNWRINLAPPQVRDYVIWHELAHTKQMNHSQKFWNLVAQLMPDYKIHLRWLKQNGYKLYLV